MEFFGLSVPFWALILAVYFIGMPLIGFPMGKWSLKVWKNPEKYPLLGKFLFPFHACDNDIGQLRAYHGPHEGPSTNLPLTMRLSVHEALQGNDPLPLAQYLVVQMIYWPIRLAFNVIVSSIFFVFKQLGSAPTRVAKLLMHCKQCVTID